MNPSDSYNYSWTAIKGALRLELFYFVEWLLHLTSLVGLSVQCGCLCFNITFIQLMLLSNLEYSFDEIYLLLQGET